MVQLPYLASKVRASQVVLVDIEVPNYLYGVACEGSRAQMERWCMMTQPTGQGAWSCSPEPAIAPGKRDHFITHRADGTRQALPKDQTHPLNIALPLRFHLIRLAPCSGCDSQRPYRPPIVTSPALLDVSAAIISIPASPAGRASAGWNDIDM